MEEEQQGSELRFRCKAETELSGLCGGEERCALYLRHPAVYDAEHETWDPAKWKWWYWKDHSYPEQEEMT